MSTGLSLFLAAIALLAADGSPFIDAVFGKKSPSESPETSAQRLKRYRLATAIVISLAILSVALYIIVAGGPPDSQKWAFCAVGTIIGYWLRH